MTMYKNRKKDRIMQSATPGGVALVSVSDIYKSANWAIAELLNKLRTPKALSGYSKS